MDPEGQRGTCSRAFPLFSSGFRVHYVHERGQWNLRIPPARCADGDTLYSMYWAETGGGGGICKVGPISVVRGARRRSPWRRLSWRYQAPFFVIGPTNTIWRQKLVKTRQKGSPFIARVDSAHEHGQWTPPAPVSELPGPVYCHFGPFWARFGPLGRAEAHHGQQAGVLGRKGTPKMVA